jgi:type II secretory pathway pseudopilin PulG
MLVRRRRNGQGEDQGIALVAVILAMAILSLFLFASLAYALQGTGPARRDQDAKTALGAAQAGIDEYLSRLNANTNYWQLGNTDTTNAAFAAAGTVIQGTGTSGARYRYSVLTTAVSTAQTGVIRLQAVGMSGPASSTTVSRTLIATLKPKGFLSYVYLTDKEMIDPALYSQPAGCTAYYYAVGSTPGRSSVGSCQNIQWAAVDTVRGPLHSNDALDIGGAVNFTSALTETSWPATQGASPTAVTWWGGASYPLGGFSPHYAAPISLPTSNNTLLANVEPDVDGDSSTPVGPGCYYTGATRIILQGTTMKVLSPSTTASNIPSRCYNPASASTEQTVAVPPVIYVDSSSTSCTLAAIGYPMTNEGYSAGSASANAWGSGSLYTPNYACTRGSVYVQGASNTQVTIASKDDIVITGDITLTGGTTGTNVVGLIAGNYVWVYHPLKTNLSTNLLSTPAVNNIAAAILALRHSFVVENWGGGAQLGTLNVTGSIAQQYRGVVALSGTSGYAKNYVYDSRLANLQPPYFLQPSSSPWQVLTVTDK